MFVVVFVSVTTFFSLFEIMWLLSSDKSCSEPLLFNTCHTYFEEKLYSDKH